MTETPSYAKGVVAGGHPATAEAGARLLRQGGNAVDAAVAAIWASFVAEPVLGSPGGGGYLTVHDAAQGRSLVYDFFADVPGRGGPRTPREAAASGDLHFFDAVLDFGPTTQAFNIGRGAIAVPGCIEGLWLAHQNHGRMPPKEVLAPAIELARDGVRVTPGMAAMLDVLSPIITHAPESAAVYAPQGQMLGAGELFKNPELAQTFELLVAEGPRPFYEGDVATEMVRIAGPEGGGLLTLEDLRRYEVKIRKPRVQRYREREVLLNPAPSAGGPLIAFALALLASFQSDELRPGGLRRKLLLAAAMEVTARERRDIVGARSPDALSELERKGHQAMLELLSAAPKLPSQEPSGRGSTTHVSALDAEDNAAAITVSNGESCGYFLPGRGIALNNFLGEEDINPDGFHEHDAGARLTSMMCPTLLLASGRPIAALGSGGSNRIRSAILQTLLNVIDEGLSMPDAVRSPRVHFERGVLSYETFDLTGEVVEALEGHFEQTVQFPHPSMFFGGVHACARLAGGALIGAGDHRRGGESAGADG